MFSTNRISFIESFALNISLTLCFVSPVGDGSVNLGAGYLE
jgi:hypothetical protein